MNMQEIVKTMNVPQHKQDLEKGQNIVWLIENLSKRNAAHPQYISLMQFLLNQASAKNLMKLSAIERVRQTLKVAA